MLNCGSTITNDWEEGKSDCRICTGKYFQCERKEKIFLSSFREKKN